MYVTITVFDQYVSDDSQNGRLFRHESNCGSLDAARSHAKWLVERALSGEHNKFQTFAITVRETEGSRPFLGTWSPLTGWLDPANPEHIRDTIAVLKGCTVLMDEEINRLAGPA